MPGTAAAAIVARARDEAVVARGPAELVASTTAHRRRVAERQVVADEDVVSGLAPGEHIARPASRVAVRRVGIADQDVVRGEAGDVVLSTTRRRAGAGDRGVADLHIG